MEKCKKVNVFEEALQVLSQQNTMWVWDRNVGKTGPVGEGGVGHLPFEHWAALLKVGLLGRGIRLTKQEAWAVYEVICQAAHSFCTTKDMEREHPRGCYRFHFRTTWPKPFSDCGESMPAKWDGEEL